MRRLIAALLLVVALGDGAQADRELAAGLVEAARKSMAVKDWPQALAQFRAAAKEEPTLLAAHRGWAEAALASGQKDEALRVLHAAVLEGEARETMPADDVAPLMAMRRKLAELDPASAAVEALLKKHGEALASLATKYLSKDPRFAESACRAALAVLPDHPQAQDRMARIQKAIAGKKVSLFNGRGFTDWMWAEPGKWDVKDGVIVANQLNDAMVIRANPRFDGDFDLLMEAKVTQRSGGRIPPYLALLGAFEGEDAFVYYGVMNEHIRVGDNTAETAAGDRLLWRAELTALDPPLNPEQWTTYEMQFSGGTLRLLVNGKVIHTLSRPPGRTGGYVAIKAQGGVFHIRKVEVVPR